MVAICLIYGTVKVFFFTDVVGCALGRLVKASSYSSGVFQLWRTWLVKRAKQSSVLNEILLPFDTDNKSLLMVLKA